MYFKALFFSVNIQCEDGVCALEIKKTPLSASGTYTCTAMNDKGRAETSCSVTVFGKIKSAQIVHYKPQQMHSNTTRRNSPSERDTSESVTSTTETPPRFTLYLPAIITAAEASTVQMRANVVGQPTPHVAWAHEAELITHKTHPHAEM